MERRGSRRRRGATEWQCISLAAPPAEDELHKTGPDVSIMASFGRLSLAVLLLVTPALSAVVQKTDQCHRSLTSPPQTPPVFNDTVESLGPAVQALCDQTKAVLDRLAATISPANATFNNTYVPILNDEHDALLTQHIQQFYASVSTEEALRDASSEAAGVQSNCSLEAQTRDDIFHLLEGVYGQLNSSKVTDAQDRYRVEKGYKSYLRSGLGLEGAQHDQFKAAKTHITNLQLRFDKNYNGDTSVIWLTPTELTGLPTDHINSLVKGTGENEGKVGLTFKAPDFSPAMALVKNPDVQDVSTFAIWEGDDSGLVGYLCMDLYPRDGKYSHFSEFTESHVTKYPAAALGVCKASPSRRATILPS
ncbi:zincin [Pleomassaria siparia CBS 279.74]|uniref:Zincin n=1 Tax=Pleomassaria siparia CBS 279.74 TaxID=1314801 RepID=A0A6G1K1K3_9PLEO|nr:zincin [Pleomassaria siparia CBS 279.74]